MSPERIAVGSGEGSTANSPRRPSTLLLYLSMEDEWERMKSLQDLQETTVLDHIQALKDQLGQAAFQVIESFVNSPLRNPKEITPSVRLLR